jgi:hypothetical protein
MPTINSVRGTFGGEGKGQPYINPWRELVNPLIYLDASFQDQTSTAIPDLSTNNRGFTLSTTVGAVHKTDYWGNKYYDLNASALIPNTLSADYFSSAATYPVVTYLLWTRLRTTNDVLLNSNGWRTLTRGLNAGHHVIVNTDANNPTIGFYDNGTAAATGNSPLGGFATDGTQTATSQTSTDGIQNATINTTSGTWTFMRVQFQATSPNQQIWINGDQTNTYSAVAMTGHPLYQSGVGVTGAGGWPGVIGGCCATSGTTFAVAAAAASTQYWGDIAVFAAYGRALTSAETLEIYNRTKHVYQSTARIATVNLRKFTTGSSFNQYLQADYEYPVTNWSITSGSLVTGLSLNASTGLISGTPTGTNTTFVVQATFSNGTTVSGTVTHNASALFTFGVGTAFTFTTAGVNGPNGPTLTQVRTAYSAQSWANTYLNMNIQGIQRWTVPSTGTYQIDAYGASGGRSGGGNVWGYATRSVGTVALNQGDVLNIVVGQGGTGSDNTSTNMAAGGGGGSVVWRDADANPLMAAGGGAGGTDSPVGSHTARHSNIDATTSNTAKTACSDAYNSGRPGATGGSSGNGGLSAGGGTTNRPGAGGGWISAGGGAYSAGGGGGSAIKTSAVGGLAGTGDTNRNGNGGGTTGNGNTWHGGFGGGGGPAGWYGCSGGGGGYSGGGAGDDGDRTAGGGGGSYNGGTNQTNTANYNTGWSNPYGQNGAVTITRIS